MPCGHIIHMSTGCSGICRLPSAKVQTESFCMSWIRISRSTLLRDAKGVCVAICEVGQVVQ